VAKKQPKEINQKTIQLLMVYREPLFHLKKSPTEGINSYHIRTMDSNTQISDILVFLKKIEKAKYKMAITSKMPYITKGKYGYVNNKINV
jgi:RNA polymerase-interacting CarD/CdnL/TRCF family regulator